MRQPHESGALCAQRDAQRRGRQAARGDYPSTTLTGAVFWIVERCVCLILDGFLVDLYLRLVCHLFPVSVCGKLTDAVLVLVCG